ncbi:MAG TPA: NnrU family protein [Steroidobacteraceae bacterium]|nr:NnrU family protein [Steroidobacteraceae bacterium]
MEYNRAANSDENGGADMPDLIAACAFFLLIHFGVSGTRLRDTLTAGLGEKPYRGLFSLASLAGIAWMVYAYRRAPLVPTWGLVLGFRPAAYVLVFIAFLFAVIGVMTPSPTTVGMESRLDPGMARGMVRITRHPFLWGVALWAATHLVVNGDVASLILFGTLLVLALGGTAAIDAKRRRRFPERWQQFAQATSSVPFAAIASGGNRLGPALAEIGPWRIIAALALYAVAFYLHGRVGPPLT